MKRKRNKHPRHRAARNSPEAMESLLRSLYGDGYYDRVREEYLRAGDAKTRSWIQAAFKRTL